MNARVQIVGESCTDVYIYGRCPRLSPEAPVPVFLQERVEHAPGMAANVRANLSALGVEAAFYTQPEPIIKTRYVEETRNHCLLRVDDDPAVLPFDWCVDAVAPLVIVDYDKGFIRKEDLENLHGNPLTFIDTKKPLGTWCQNLTFIKINEHEYERSRDFVQENPWLQSRLIVTLGQRGALWRGQRFPVQAATVHDVTGAGDTFFAGFVARYLKTGDVVSAIEFANACAHAVVILRGTSVVPESLKTLLNAK